MLSKYKAKTSITLDPDILTKLKIEAKHQRRSVSQLVEIWLQDMLFFRGESDAATNRRGIAPDTKELV